MMAPMRRLFRRDAVDPALLLKMATVNGLDALGLDRSLATLESGSAAHLVSVRIDPDDPTDPLTQAMENDYPVQPIE